MENVFSPLQDEFVGLRVNKPIYNRHGILVIPKHSTLTRKHLHFLRKHGITLCMEDVEHIAVLEIVNKAIQEIKQIFAEVKRSHLIPYRSIREELVPMIVRMSQHPMIDEFLSNLSQHDEYTYRHSIGVALFARLIGKRRGLNEHDLTELTTAGVLHDIGKLKVPEAIIQKPGKLTSEEYLLIQRHTIFGYELIKQAEGASHRQAIVALQHHEREDGSGYPYGLKGSEIDDFSKIIAVADVFHAMASKRIYKKPIPFYRVLQELSDQAFQSLEPKTTLSFIKQIMDMTIGNRVILSNGSEGKIVMVHSSDPIHPLVNVDGNYIDLRKERSVLLDQIC